MHNKIAYYTLLVTAATMLSSCALFKAFENESEVRDYYGEPTLIQQNADGTRSISYAQQPDGEHYWRFLVAANGKILQQEDGLSEASLRQIHLGMSMQQVHQKLGPPRSEQRLTGASQFSQEWRIQRQDPAALGSFFMVHFNDKKNVVQTGYRHEYRSPWRGTVFFFGDPVRYYCGGLFNSCQAFLPWIMP